MWGGREGVEAEAAKDIRSALDRYKEAVDLCCEYIRSNDLGLRIALEPKPNEPRGDILLPTVGHALAFINELEWPEMVGVNPEFAHETMSGLSFTHAIAQTLWHGKLFHIDLNAQRPGKYDQDFRFGSEGIRDAFYVVKLLEESNWQGPRHFDAHPYRTEDGDGIWDFAWGCMRTYLILAEKAPVRTRFRDSRSPTDSKVLQSRAAHDTGGRPLRDHGFDGRRVVAGVHRVWARAARSTGDGVAARSPIVPLVVGVDSSTSACKVQVRDAESGRLISTGQASHPATSPPRSEQEPSEWWRAFEAACGQADVQKHGPAGLSFAAQQHGLVVLGPDHRPLRPAKLWNDTESAQDSSDLIAALAGGASEWASACGSVPLASFTITKLRWLRRQEPDTFRRIRSVLLPHDWLTSRATGKRTTDCGMRRGPVTGHRPRAATAMTFSIWWTRTWHGPTCCPRSSVPTTWRENGEDRGRSLVPVPATTWRPPSAWGCDRGTWS